MKKSENIEKLNKSKIKCIPPEGIQIKGETFINKGTTTGLVVVLKTIGIFSKIEQKDLELLFKYTIKHPHCLFVLDCSELIPDDLSLFYKEKIIQLFLKRRSKIVLIGLLPDLKSIIDLNGLSQFYDITDTVDNVIKNYADKYFSAVSCNKFPQKTNCPICGTKNVIKNVGRFRCFECKTILFIDHGGKIIFDNIYMYR